MEEVAEVAAIESFRKKQDADLQDSVSHFIPIEQRMDVTVDELEKLSLPYPAELYNGKVVYKMANYAHGLVQSKLNAELQFFLREHPIGDVVTETNFQLWPNRPKESRIPDIAFVKKDRVPKNQQSFPAMAPDLTIEILSPKDNFFAVMDKVDEYLQQGVKAVWLVMPRMHEVLVRTKDKKYNVADVLTAPDILPGFELPVSRIFEGLSQPE